MGNGGVIGYNGNMRRVRNKKSPSGYLIKISLFIACILIVTLVFVANRSDLFTLKKIDLTAEDIPCVDEGKLKNSSGLLGQKLYLTNFEKVARNLKDKFICIKNIDLAYVFPDKVRIKASGRKSVAALVLLKDKEATMSSFLENIATPSAEESSDVYLVDNEGVIFKKSTGDLSVPNIYIYDSNFSLGKKPESSNTEDSLKILNKVKTFGLDIRSAVILDNFFIIFSYPKVVFRLDSRIETQIASLQLILAEAKIDLKELEFIDLRFDKPIIRFAPKK